MIQALDHVRHLLPFPLLGIDTDNGTEFLNAELLAYCEREQLTFTRGRVGKKKISALWSKRMARLYAS